MNPGLIAAFFIAILITVTIVLLNRRGPWGSVWTLFVILFLALWTATVYLRFGPEYYGVPWVPIVVIGIVLSLILAFVIPDANHWRDESLHESSSVTVKRARRERRLPALSGWDKFFWIISIALIIAIIVGVANPQAAH